MNDIDDLLKESRKLQEDFNKTNPQNIFQEYFYYYQSEN